MKKLAALMLLIAILAMAACKPAAKQATDTTGDAIVNTVGSDLNNIDNIEDELSTDELESLGADLQEIQDI